MENKLYDLARLRAIADGDEDFMQKMISLFISQAPELCREMNDHFNEGSWHNVYVTAHKLKPTIDSMGIITLKDTIRKVELWGAGKPVVADDDIFKDILFITDTIQATCRQLTDEG